MRMSDAPQESENGSENGGPLLSPRSIILILVTAALVTISFAGWRDIYDRYLEASGPLIELIESPRGVGLTPVSMKFHVIDLGSGLDEVVARTRQKSVMREMLREPLRGARSKTIIIDFPGEKSNLEEGLAELEIKAFDRSFWNNSTSKVYQLKIDYRRPKVEVLTTQHNARHGGSQLVFYKALDEDLAVSGVKVGPQTYIGYPARAVDREFGDSTLFVALYAVDLRQEAQEMNVRVFAEDVVGNATSVNFYNKIQPRGWRDVPVNIGEDMLRSTVSNLADQNFAKLQEAYRRTGENLTYKSSRSGVDRLIEKFNLVNERLRVLNDNEIATLLKGPRYESYWSRAFRMPPGGIQVGYGDQLTFLFDGQRVGQTHSVGYEIMAPYGNYNVVAANDGIVVFSDNIGVYGRTVAVDHGLGVVSLYGHLDQALVSKGEVVTRGQKIALAGNSGLARSNGLYFEMRVQGVPVDPIEWCDEGWFEAHVTGKVNDLKKMLGIPIYRPLE